jgi:hypothetical protein
MGVQRRTSPGKLRKSVMAFSEWIRKNRHIGIKNIMKTLNRKLRGYWNYYGVRGNYESLSTLYYRVNQLLFKWLNRRSQKKSYTWEKYNRMCKRFSICTPVLLRNPHNQTCLIEDSAKRVFSKSPVREYCTPGSVRGHPGNRVFYLDFRL